MPCLHIVAIWARNFNNTNWFSKDSIESHSRDATVSRLKQYKQCIFLWWQPFFHISVGCCICWLDIKSCSKQTIQNLTSWKNQKQNATHIQIDFWIQTTVPEPIAARFGRPLIFKYLFNCQAWLHQHQSKSKLSQVNWYANVSSKGHDPFKQRQFPVCCQTHLLVGFWGSTHSLPVYCWIECRS